MCTRHCALGLHGKRRCWWSFTMIQGVGSIRWFRPTSTCQTTGQNQMFCEPLVVPSPDGDPGCLAHILLPGARAPCNVNISSKCGSSAPFDFKRLGQRSAAMLISPLVRKGAVHQHPKCSSRYKQRPFDGVCSDGGKSSGGRDEGLCSSDGPTHACGCGLWVVACDLGVVESRQLRSETCGNAGWVCDEASSIPGLGKCWGTMAMNCTCTAG